MKNLTIKKTISFALVVIMMCGIFSACSNKSPSPSEANKQVEETLASEPISDTRIITDMFGREVEIPTTIESVAVAGSTARILTYAGCADKITGVTDMDKTIDVNMPYSVVNADAFALLTSVGAGGSKDVSYEEELVSLSPDIIFANKGIDTITELQEKTGIPVIGITYDGIFSEDVYSAMALVGDIMDTQEHCTALVTQMKAWQDDLNNRTKDIADENKPSVYSGAVSFKGAHGFEGTYGKYPPFTAVNAKNVVDETGETGALIIDIEKVTAWDPKIIFLNPTNMNLVNENYKTNKAFYDNLTAVQEGKLYSQISFNYNSTNIEIAIADAYYAGKIMFPEQFEDIDIETKADEIFKLMLGTNYYQNLVDAGIGFSKLSIGE